MMPRPKHLTKQMIKLKQQILRSYSLLYQPIYLIKLALKVYQLTANTKLTLFINKVLIDFKQQSKKHNQFLKLKEANPNQVDVINSQKLKILNQRKELLEEFISIVQAQNIKIDNEKFLLQKISTKISNKASDILKNSEFKKSKQSKVPPQNSAMKSISLKPQKLHQNVKVNRINTEQPCSQLNIQDNLDVAKSFYIEPRCQKRKVIPSIQFLLRDQDHPKKIIKKSSILCSKPVVTFRNDQHALDNISQKPIKSLKRNLSRPQTKHSIKNASKQGSKVQFGLLDSCFDQNNQNSNQAYFTRVSSRKKLSSKQISQNLESKNQSQNIRQHQSKMSKIAINQKILEPNLQLLKNNKLVKSRRNKLTISSSKSSDHLQDSLKDIYQKKNTVIKNRLIDTKDFKYKIQQSKRSSRTSSRNSKNSAKKLQRLILKKKSLRQQYIQTQIEPIPLRKNQSAAALRFRYCKVLSQTKDQSMKKRQGFYRKLDKAIQQIKIININSKLNTTNGKVNHDELKAIRDNFVQFKSNIPQIYYYITENKYDQAERIQSSQLPNNFIMRFHSEDYGKQSSKRSKRHKQFEKQEKMFQFAEKIAKNGINIDQCSINQSDQKIFL